MSATVLFGRALRLRCPHCGQGRLFRGWFAMNPRCSGCGLRFEREPGYFLGSIYINYGLTALIITLAYLIPMFVTGRPDNRLLLPLVAFSLVFPLFFFRYARSLWLAFDHYWHPMEDDDRVMKFDRKT